MQTYRRQLRRLLLLSACLASASLGMAAVWLLVPTGFAGFVTGDLMAVAALILLPVLTVWAVRHDRAEQARVLETTVGARPLVEQAPTQRAARKSVIHERSTVSSSNEQQRV